MAGRVYVNHLCPPIVLVDKVRAALQFLRWEDLIPTGSRVFIKPNLTWRRPQPGVTVTPEFLAATVEVLRERTRHIIVGESSGGYHTFPAEEAFESHGLYDLAKRFGIDVVNLSRCEEESVTGVVAGRPVDVELPKLLLHDIDVFITLPVPKVHTNTTVSLGFKNQWGCIPNPMRLRQHARFAEKIVLINRVLRPRLALFDGTYMLDRNGPMIGDPVETRLIIASDDVGAGSLACCEIMRIDPWSAKHLRLARHEGMIPSSLQEVILNQPIEPFRSHRFRVQRNVVNWASYAAFHSELLTKIIYDSRAADLLHRALYRVRRNRIAGRFLYGNLGPPEIEGHREDTLLKPS
jgi:uncharacterized protein (DUF362 family)